MSRWLRWSAAAALALLVAAYALRNVVARHAIEWAVQRRTGFGLRVAAADLGLLGGTLDVHGIELTNPPEFADRRFVSVALVHVEYDPRSLLGTPHLRRLDVRVSQVVLVRNERGERNSAKLAATLRGGGRRPGRARYRVDALHVKVGTVLVEEYARGRRDERKLVLEVDRTYRNVSESTDVSALVFGTVLDQLGSIPGEVTQGLGGAVKGLGKDVGEILKVPPALPRKR